MDSTAFCPNCGKRLADGAPPGLCPDCLAKAGVEMSTANDPPPPPAFDPPPAPASVSSPVPAGVHPTVQTSNPWKRVIVICCLLLIGLAGVLGWFLYSTWQKLANVKLPAAIAAVNDLAISNAYWTLLNDDQRTAARFLDRKFENLFDVGSFDSLTAAERAALIERSLDILNEKRSDDYYRAINTLAALRATNALIQLRRMALDPGPKQVRVEANNRPRWMAIRALGIMGDKASTPRLIYALYHNNSYVRWAAQLSLVRLTGQNFSNNWNAWGNWWNAQNIKPKFDPRSVHWWQSQPDPAELVDCLAGDDQKFIESAGRRKATESAEAANPTPAPIDDDFWLNLDRRNYTHYRQQLQKAPRVLVVRLTHYDFKKNAQLGIGMHWGWIDGKLANLCVSFADLVCYGLTKNAVFDEEALVRIEMPDDWKNGHVTNQFDVIDTYRQQPVPHLQTEIKRVLKEEFGYSWRRETRNTDVLLIKVKDPQLLASKITTDFSNSGSLGEAASTWANFFGKPVLDETLETNRFDKEFEDIPAAYHSNRTTDMDANNEYLAKYGLELVATSRPMEWFALDPVSKPAKTTSATPNLTKNCTLKLEYVEKTVHNPTAADIRNAIRGIGEDVGPIGNLSADGTKEILEIDALGKGHYGFGFTDGQKQEQAARGDFSFDEAVAIMLAYGSGDPDWKGRMEWKPLQQ